MKKPVVDYREFRFSKLNTPQFSHMKLAIFGWLFYFSFYFLTENLIPPEICHPMHCALDDMIPFCEYFAVFYVFWYALVFGSLIYTLLYDPKSFSKLSLFIFITQLIAMTIYILYPSRQDLRPEAFVRDNFLTRLMAVIYSFDTSTGVCPSLHVAYSMGILSVGLKNKAGVESSAGVRGRDDLSCHGVRQAALDGRRVRRAAGQPGGRAVRLLGRLLEAEALRKEKSIKQKSARQHPVARIFCAAARQRFDNRADVGYSVWGRRGHQY